MDGYVRLNVFSETFARADVIDIQSATAELPTGLIEKIDAIDDKARQQQARDALTRAGTDMTKLVMLDRWARNGL